MRVRLSAVVNKLRSPKIPLALIAILVIGAFLRFFLLAQILLYDDEPLHQIRISYESFLFAYAHYNGSALFTLLVHILLRLGDIVLISRLPSALFGTVTMAVVYVLGKRFFSKKEGLIAAALTALSPFLIRYSQYSRTYALFVLLSLLSLYFFAKAQEDGRMRSWIGYVVFTVLDISTHLMAVLILPAYAVYIALTARRRARKNTAAAESQRGRLKKYVLSTLVVCVLAACFYLPSVSIQEFFAGSAQRALSQPDDIRLSPFLIGDIIQSQAKLPSTSFSILFFACLAIGFAAAARKQTAAAGLSFLTIAIPYSIFVLIKPRDVNVLSADRYFIFILPVLLLFLARGITALGILGPAIAGLFKRPKALGRGIRNILQTAIVLLVAAGIFSSFKDYYLEYWRLGSLRIDRSVAAFLKTAVKRDAVIYFDIWPVSSLPTVINPLAAGLRPEEFELMIREGFTAEAPKNDFIVFRVGPMIFQEYVAGLGVDLWAVTPLAPDLMERLTAEALNRPGIEVRTAGSWAVLHLQNADERVAQKMGALARLLLSLPLDKMREQRCRLMAAKSALTVSGPEPAYEDIQAFKAESVPPHELEKIPSSFVFRFFDRIFGLSPLKLYDCAQRRDLTEIERLLYIDGNGHLRQNELDDALEAYRTSLSLGSEFELRISEKLAVVAERKLGQGESRQARILYQEAVDLNPTRKDFRFCLAEMLRREGLTERATEEYKKAFGLASLPPDFVSRLSGQPQGLILWEKDRFWHLLFRAEENAVISGTMTASKTAASGKQGFESRDSVRFSPDGIQFAVTAKRGAVKILTFRMAKTSRPEFDLKINGRRAAADIIILNGGRIP